VNRTRFERERGVESPNGAREVKRDRLGAGAFKDYRLLRQFQNAEGFGAGYPRPSTAGRYADSLRESIHSVESTARVLEPSGSLSGALARLEKKANIHGALKQGFNSLYGYSSDEQGVRHALLDAGDANVDEADALFMFGACAAFVSYLINKARAAGLLD
jgi:hypothetical protein